MVILSASEIPSFQLVAKQYSILFVDVDEAVEQAEAAEGEDILLVEERRW